MDGEGDHLVARMDLRGTGGEGSHRRLVIGQDADLPLGGPGDEHLGLPDHTTASGETMSKWKDLAMR